jgi:hypothetical protein
MRSAVGKTSSTQWFCQLTINSAPVSSTNPLTDMNQAEVDVSNDHAQYKWAKLRYRVTGSNQQQFTAAFVVANQGDQRDHYIQQMFIRPRSEDGTYSQSQTDAMVSSRAISPEELAESSDLSMRIATGVSDRGDMQEALEDAVRNANDIVVRETGIIDALLIWQLRDTSGRWGSIAGIRETRVSIVFALPGVQSSTKPDGRVGAAYAPKAVSKPVSTR